MFLEISDKLNRQSILIRRTMTILLCESFILFCYEKVVLRDFDKIIVTINDAPRYVYN